MTQQEYRALFLAIGTGFFIFTFFCVGSLLMHVPHTKMLDLIKVFLFGNKSGIVLKFFKLKLLAVVIFIRIIYFVSLKYLSILYLPWALTYFTVFSMIFDWIFGFILLETGVCILFYLACDYFGIETMVLDYSFHSWLKKGFDTKFQKLLTNDAINMIRYYNSATKHSNVSSSTSHTISGRARTPRSSVKLDPKQYFESDYYLNSKHYLSSTKKSNSYLNLDNSKRYWKNFDMFKNRLQTVSGYETVSGEIREIELRTLGQISSSANDEINKGWNLLLNKIFVIKYNNDGTFPVLRSDQGWVGYSIKELKNIQLANIDIYGEREFFELFDKFSSVLISQDLSLVRPDDSKVVREFFQLPENAKLELCNTLHERINIAYIQQEQQIIINKACGAPATDYIPRSQQSEFIDLYGRLNGFCSPKGNRPSGDGHRIPSGIGDFLVYWNHFALVESKNREWLQQFVNNSPNFLGEAEIGRTRGANFFRGLLSSDAPEDKILEFGLEFGKICSKNEIYEFAICGTNVGSIPGLDLGLPPSLDGASIVAKNNDAIIYRITEEERLAQKLELSPAFSGGQKREFLKYVKNFHILNKGTKEYGVDLTRVLATRIERICTDDYPIIKKLNLVK